MTVRQMEMATLKDVQYYTLFTLDKGAEWNYGKELKAAYKRLGNAKRKFNQLVASGKYSSVILRLEDVWLRDANNEYGCSSVFKAWNDKIGIYRDEEVA